MTTLSARPPRVSAMTLLLMPSRVWVSTLIVKASVSEASSRPRA